MKLNKKGASVQFIVSVILAIFLIFVLIYGASKAVKYLI